MKRLTKKELAIGIYQTSVKKGLHGTCDQNYYVKGILRGWAALQPPRHEELQAWYDRLVKECEALEG